MVRKRSVGMHSDWEEEGTKVFVVLRPCRYVGRRLIAVYSCPGPFIYSIFILSITLVTF